MPERDGELTPAQRSLRARIAVHTSWAKTADRAARTAPARAAQRARFEREVDPDGVLAPDELARRVDSARKAYYTRLALASVKARQRQRRASKPDGQQTRAASPPVVE